MKVLTGRWQVSGVCEMKVSRCEEDGGTDGAEGEDAATGLDSAPACSGAGTGYPQRGFENLNENWAALLSSQ